MRRLLTRKTTRITALAITAALLTAGLALAYYSGAIGTATAGATVGTLAAPTNVSATASGPSVNVNWTGVTAPTGGQIGGYYVQRTSGNTTTPACGSSPSNLLSGSATSCTDTGNPAGNGVPAGTYTYTVTAVWTSWSSTGTSGSVTVAGPTVTSTQPSSADVGASNLNVAITGTNFVSGATVAFSGSGITVNQVTYNSQTSLTANISIASSAATGGENVTVTNPDSDQATGTGVFTVNAAPTITSVAQPKGYQGETLNVTINGTGFESFGAGVANNPQATFSNPGITVNSTTYISPTQVTANVTIASGATTGPSNVTVTDPDGASATDSGAVFWSVYDTGAIGRANRDGSGANSSFISGGNNPHQVTTNASYVYWANYNGTIGRATLTDGGTASQGYATDQSPATGVAVDGSYIYWADRATNSIGRETLNNSSAEPSWITAGVSTPEAVVVDGGYVYWINVGNGTIGRATLSGVAAPGPGQTGSTFISGIGVGDTDNQGLAVDGSFIYWANRGGTTIGRANLDGTGVNQSFISNGVNNNSVSNPTGVAVDASYVYWANGSGTIGRATLSGVAAPGPGQTGSTFISGLLNLQGVAVNVPFTIDAAPSISQANPSFARPGDSSDTISITGSGFQPGAQVAFSNPGITVGSPTVVNSTDVQVTISVSSTATPGTGTVTVTNPDQGSASSAFTVAPASPAISAEPSNPSASGAPSFSFSGNGTGYVCSLDGASFTACTSPKAYSGVADGSHTFQVEATQGVATSQPTSYSWTIDSSAPTITSQPTNPSASNSPTFAFSHTRSAYTFQCKLDSGSYSSCASPQSYSGLPDGSHTFRVQAISGDGAVTNAATYTWVIATLGPTQAFSLASGASHAALNGTTVYYNGATTGSFNLIDTVTAATPVTSPASAAFPAIATSGWTHNAETVSTPAGGPYTSGAFSWTATPTNPTGYAVTGKDSLGNSTATGLTFVSDTTAPTGGALSVNGAAATGAGSTSTASSASFPINSRSDYTETQSSTQSGLQSSVLTVQSESLSGSTCGSPGSGGPFTTATTITGTTQPSGIVTGFCYLYTLTGTDNVGNAIAVSTTVTVSLPTITAVSPAQGLDGAANLLVTVTGTHFQSDAAVTFSGAGITVNSTTYNSATQLTANITIASSAATGARDVTVTNQADTGSATAAGAFTILSRPAAALFVADNFFATVGDDSIAANGQLTPISGGPSGANGQGISVTPDGRFAYVSNAGGGSISQYSIAADGTMSSLSPATVPAGLTPRGEAISTDGKSLYVAEYDGNAIREYTIGSDGQLSPKVPATVPANGAPWGIALSPDGKALFAADFGGNVVSQYLIGASGGLSRNSPATVAAGAGPIEIAVSPDGTSAYVSNQNDGTVSQYTIANDKLTANSPASVNAGGSGTSPHDVVVSPDAKSAYVADFNNNNASVVWQYSIGAGGALTSKSPATVSAGSGPFAAAITPDGNYFYVSDLGGSPAGAISEFSVGTGGSLSPLSPSQLTPASNRSPFAMVVEESLQIGTAATLPGAAVGTPYSQPLWSISGTAPVTYNLSSGSLPDGLSLSSGGVISGTPTTPQTKTFTVTAMDSSSTQQASQKVFTLTVQ